MPASFEIDRREFLLGSTAALVAAGLPLNRVFAAIASEPLLDWAELTAHTRAQAALNLGGNSLVVFDGDEVLVVDSKFPYLGEALREDATSFISADAPSVSLLNTHHHGDHSGGNMAFVGRGDTYAHENAVERIRGQFEHYRQGMDAAVPQAAQNFEGNEAIFELAAGVASNADRYSPDDWAPVNALGGETSLTVGDVEIEVRHFGPGHTDNDLVIRIENDNVVHTGDLVFHGLHPYFDPEGGSTARGWIKSLKKTVDLCDETTVVVPGHGSVGDKAVIAGQIAYLEQLIGAVQKEIDAGGTRDEVAGMSWPFMDGLGFEQIRGRAIGAVYDELTA